MLAEGQKNNGVLIPDTPMGDETKNYSIGHGFIVAKPKPNETAFDKVIGSVTLTNPYNPNQTKTFSREIDIAKLEDGSLDLSGYLIEEDTVIYTDENGEEVSVDLTAYEKTVGMIEKDITVLIPKELISNIHSIEMKSFNDEYFSCSPLEYKYYLKNSRHTGDGGYFGNICGEDFYASLHNEDYVRHANMVSDGIVVAIKNNLIDSYNEALILSDCEVDTVFSMAVAFDKNDDDVAEYSLVFDQIDHSKIIRVFSQDDTPRISFVSSEDTARTDLRKIMVEICRDQTRNIEVILYKSEPNSNPVLYYSKKYSDFYIDNLLITTPADGNEFLTNWKYANCIRENVSSFLYYSSINKNLSMVQNEYSITDRKLIDSAIDAGMITSVTPNEYLYYSYKVILDETTVKVILDETTVYVASKTRLNVTASDSGYKDFYYKKEMLIGGLSNYNNLTYFFYPDFGKDYILMAFIFKKLANEHGWNFKIRTNYDNNMNFEYSSDYNYFFVNNTSNNNIWKKEVFLVKSGLANVTHFNSSEIGVSIDGGLNLHKYYNFSRDFEFEEMWKNVSNFVSGGKIKYITIGSNGIYDNPSVLSKNISDINGINVDIGHVFVPTHYHYASKNALIRAYELDAFIDIKPSFLFYGDIWQIDSIINYKTPTLLILDDIFVAYMIGFDTIYRTRTGVELNTILAPHINENSLLESQNTNNQQVLCYDNHLTPLALFFSKLGVEYLMDKDNPYPLSNFIIADIESIVYDTFNAHGFLSGENRASINYVIYDNKKIQLRNPMFKEYIERVADGFFSMKSMLESLLIDIEFGEKVCENFWSIDESKTKKVNIPYYFVSKICSEMLRSFAYNVAKSPTYSGECKASIWGNDGLINCTVKPFLYRGLREKGKYVFSSSIVCNINIGDIYQYDSAIDMIMSTEECIIDPTPFVTDSEIAFSTYANPPIQPQNNDYTIAVLSNFIVDDGGFEFDVSFEDCDGNIIPRPSWAKYINVDDAGGVITFESEELL